MIVMKFGGTSVESAAAIGALPRSFARPIERRPVVVVSAMGKTTNRLLAIASGGVAQQRERALPNFGAAPNTTGARLGPWSAGGRAEAASGD
jgi:aspartokinase